MDENTSILLELQKLNGKIDLLISRLDNQQKTLDEHKEVITRLNTQTAYLQSEVKKIKDTMQEDKDLKTKWNIAIVTTSITALFALLISFIK